MQEELNVRLLQKISCMEMGAVSGKVLCGCFFLMAIVYFVKEKIYIVLAGSLKKKAVYVKNKIKKKRMQQTEDRVKGKMKNKVYFKLMTLFFAGIGGISIYRPYCADAIVTNSAAADENTEGIYSIGVKSPDLYLESEDWIEGTGEFSQYLFSKDNRIFKIGVEDNTFYTDQEKESFLFQVSEKKDSLNKEDNSDIIRQYEQSELERKDSDRAIYQKQLLLGTDKNSQKEYSLYLKYINKWGMPLSRDKEQMANYGNVLSGIFKSRNLVIDKKCPEMKKLRIKEQDKKKERIVATEKEDNETYDTDRECYCNTSVKGIIDVQEKYLDLDSIHIQAVPLDEKAGESIRESEAENNNDTMDILAWTHTQKGDLHQISFDFCMEGKWKFIFDCADIAGNVGVVSQTGLEQMESTDITIDKSAPELSVTYTGIINVMEEESSPANVNKKLKSNGMQITSSQNELFMKKENAINICIEDVNLKPEDIELKLYRVEYGLNGKIAQSRESWEDMTEKIEQQPGKEEQEKSDGRVKLYSVKNLEDGHYKLIIHCKDKAGNVMEAKGGSETAKCIHNGYYESPLYTVDTVKPVITTVDTNQNIVRKIGKRKYFQKVPRITIKIEEENFNKMNLALNGKMFYANGIAMEEEWEHFKRQEENLQWKSYYENGVRVSEVSMEADTEANYTLYFDVADSAACVADQKELQITYDCHKPEITYTGVDNESGDLIFKAETNGDNKKQDALLLFHKYHFFRYFSKRKINVSIRVKDNISGVRAINYAFISSGEKPIHTFSQIERVGIKEIEDGKLKDENLSEFSITVSPKDENFKGYLEVYGQDYSENAGDVVKSKGAISESSQLHKEASNITIKMPRAFFIDKDKNIRYYSKTTPVQAIFEDKQTGIYKTGLYAKYASPEKDNSVQEGKAIMWDGESVVYRKIQQIMLDADKLSQSDAEHPLIIQADLEDNAGHTGKNVLGEKVVIDNVKPEIMVEYDQNNKTPYYNAPRKAIVTVKEKNFAPNLVEWNIQGSNQKYRIGEWKGGQKDTHICEVYFEEDGEDYSVGLSVTDYAGNKSEWKDRSYFTIDKTVPQISIQIEEDRKRNTSVTDLQNIEEDRKRNISVTDLQNIEEDRKQNLQVVVAQNTGGIKEEYKDPTSYFNQEQIVTFCIQDQNFDKDKVKYNIEATNEKKKINIKEPMEYQRYGDKYYSTLVLKKEARYHIQVKCTDKAGNESEAVETREFVIDTTSPKIQVAGVKQDGVYEGEEILPQVICTDHYLDKASVGVFMKRINGDRVPKKEWNYERVEDGNTVQIQWDNIKKSKNSDGIYYLQVEGEDKAGNKVRDNFKVVFRVNQQGADFILSNDLKKKIGKYYLKEAPKIELKEQCVKQTKSRAVILKDNEEKQIIEERKITSSIIADKKSERYGWYEKYYNFAKKDFDREGDYRVTFQADRKEKELRFIVDKTPPIVHISNLDEQIYKEKKHEFTISVMDNYAFEELELYIETDGGIFSPKETKKIIIEPEDLDENYMVRKILTRNKDYQTVRYIAKDKAGNVIDSNDNGDTKVCLVTDNKDVQEYHNYKKDYRQIAVIGILGIASTGAIGGLALLFKKRKYKTR